MNILGTLSVLLNVVLGALAFWFYRRYHKLDRQWKESEEAQKEQFYEIVHELRAPLTAVKDAALLLQDTGSLSQQDQEKMLKLIKNECVSLLDMVSSVLDASKVMSRKLTLEKTPNNLKNLLEEKVIMYSAQAKAKDIQLVSAIDPGLTIAMYDPKYLSQVMNNLISNSIKYTPPGGKITISGQVTAKEIVVSVFDNGTGLSEDKQKALFTRFATVNDHKSVTPSSGLGLYVAKSIIEAHGGTVKVETHRGRGYKATFTLPMNHMPSSLASAVPPTPVTTPTPIANPQPAMPPATPQQLPSQPPMQQTTI